MNNQSDLTSDGSLPLKWINLVTTGKRHTDPCTYIEPNGRTDIGEFNCCLAGLFKPTRKRAACYDPVSKTSNYNVMGAPLLKILLLINLCLGIILACIALGKNPTNYGKFTNCG